MAGELRLGVGTAPSTSANNVVIYGDSADKRTKVIDQNGVISILNNDGLQDRNIITNGGFSVQQRVATAATAIPLVSTTTRAGQVADRWAVTVGNVTTPLWTQVETAAAVETGLESGMYGKITQNTNAAKFILSQFIINDEMAHLRGKKVRLSCKIKQFVGSNAVYRLGLLQLTAAGTMDVCPAFISAIGAASVEPTWGTNLAAITPDASPTGENGTISGVALSITSTNAWVKSSCVFSIPSDAKNLMPVLYRDTLGAASDAVGIAEFLMTQGPDIVDWVAPPMIEEVLRCQRFFCKSFPMTVVPAVSLTEATAGSGATGMCGKAGALAVAYGIKFPVTMFKVPTITYFTPTSTGAQVWRFTGAAAAACSSTATRTNSITDQGFVVSATGDAGAAVGDLVGVHFTADAEFVA